MSASWSEVSAALATLAPLELAEDWDNVGLVLDPRGVDANTRLSRALVTIDWTAETLAEAIDARADLIVSYHPPLFSGLKRLRRGAPAEDLAVRTLGAGLVVYSPHTALDAASGGMAEWLGRALGPGLMRPLRPHPADAKLGAGRFVELAAPAPPDEVVRRIKEHLGLSHLRVAWPNRGPSNGPTSGPSSGPSGVRPIGSLAVCPGAGGSLFAAVGEVDLLLTGEMRHHDVLARVAAGTTVVLTDHTNSERGYLSLFAERLQAGCPGLEVQISRVDRDPLAVV